MAVHLGEALRGLREARGYTQDEMGEALGMSGTGYQRIESGRHRHYPSTLRRLDDRLIAAGFDWHPGKAAGIAHDGLTAPGVVDRLTAIEALLTDVPTRLDVDRNADRLTRIEAKVLDLLEYAAVTESFVRALVEHLVRIQHEPHLIEQMHAMLDRLEPNGRRTATPPE